MFTLDTCWLGAMWRHRRPGGGRRAAAGRASARAAHPPGRALAPSVDARPNGLSSVAQSALPEPSMTATRPSRPARWQLPRASRKDAPTTCYLLDATSAGVHRSRRMSDSDAAVKCATRLPRFRFGRESHRRSSVTAEAVEREKYPNTPRPTTSGSVTSAGSKAKSCFSAPAGARRHLLIAYAV